MSRVKSAGEKKGEKEERAGEVQGETMDLAAFEDARAAGSWQQDFETRSPTNPLLWQMPDVSHHFPTFSVYGLLAHSRKLFFYWREPRTWKGHAQGAPTGTEPSEPDLPFRQQELCQGQGCRGCHWTPDSSHCSERYLKGHLREFQPHLWKDPDKQCRWLFQPQLVGYLGCGYAVSSHLLQLQQL